MNTHTQTHWETILKRDVSASYFHGGFPYPLCLFSFYTLVFLCKTLWDRVNDRPSLSPSSIERKAFLTAKLLFPWWHFLKTGMLWQKKNCIDSFGCSKMRVVHVRTRDLDLRQDKIKLSFVSARITLQMMCTVEVIQGVFCDDRWTKLSTLYQQLLAQ